MIRAGGSNSTPGLGGDRAAVPDGNPVRSGGGGGGRAARGARTCGGGVGLAGFHGHGGAGGGAIDRSGGGQRRRRGEQRWSGSGRGEERRGEDDEAEARERERGRGGFCAWPKSRDPLTSHHLASRAGAAPVKGEAKAIELGTPTPDPDPDPGGRSSHARRRMTVINLARARVLCGRVVVASLHRGIVATREMLIGEKKSRRRGRVRLSRKLISVRVFGLVQSSLDLTCVLETWSINIASTVCS